MRQGIEAEQARRAAADDQLAHAGIAKLQVEFNRGGAGRIDDVDHRAADRTAGADDEHGIVARSSGADVRERGARPCAELAPGFRRAGERTGDQACIAVLRVRQ